MEYKIPKTFSTTCGLRSEKGGIAKPKNEKRKSSEHAHVFARFLKGLQVCMVCMV